MMAILLIVGLTSCSEEEANADIQESLDQVKQVVLGKIDSVYVKEGEPLMLSASARLR